MLTQRARAVQTSTQTDSEMKKTIEEQTSALINDTPTTITIDGTRYKVTPPTLAKLANISSEVAQLELTGIEPTDIVGGALREAKHAREIARVISTVIEGPTNRESIFKRIRNVLRRETLADKIYRSVTPAEANEILSEALKTLQLGDFFGLTTFLGGLNITRQTKVETEATAPGA